jgi:O-antigen ligase
MLEFRPWPAQRVLTANAQTIAFVAVAALWALAVMLISAMAAAAAALAGAGVLLIFAGLSRRYPHWCVFALLVIVDVLPSANFLPISEADRPLLRYPLYLLFCAPMLPAVWRSGILSRGGFRLYSIYLLWAIASAAWSLVPVYSFGRALGSSLLFVALCSVAMGAEAQDRDYVERIIRYVLLACAVLTAIIAITAVTPFFPSAWFLDPELAAYRLQGIFDSPNQVGELNMVTIGAALACWNSLRWPAQKIGAAVLIALSAVMMAAADSRSPAAAIVLGVAALAVWRYGWRGILGVTAAAAIAVLLAAGLGPHATLYLARTDVATLSGRTPVMRFAIHRVMDHPLLGYGFLAEGQIFQNRYFPSWDDLWELGPRVPIHNGYISRAVGLGVPAALLWMFLFVRPFAALFARRANPYARLKQFALLLVLPVLILYLSETLGGDCHYPTGIVSTLVWALAERQRLRAGEPARVRDGPIAVAGLVWGKSAPAAAMVRTNEA